MVINKNIAAIIPARMTSSRLPGKALMPIAGKPALQRMVERVKASKRLDDIIIAITTNKEDDILEEFCQEHEYNYFRGSENNVLERIIGAAKKFDVDVIAECTSDCPLIYWWHFNHLIDLHMESYPEYDLTTNIGIRTFPRGFDIRIVNIEVLEKSFKEIDNQPDFEHALTWLYLHPEGSKKYKVQNWEAPPSQHRPDLEFTMDTEADLELLSWIFSFESNGYNLELNPEQIISLIDTYPGQYEKVAKVQRKNYFAELKQYYEGAKKQNEQVQCADSRGRKTGSKRGRPRKQKDN